MKSKPIVSIIVPTLNEEQDIEEFLASVKNQTYKNIEVIIVDGGSTDRTIEISKKYKVKIIILPKANVTISRNRGAKIAKGEILHFMDADCVLMDRNYIEKVVRAYKKYDVDIVVNRTDAYPPKNIIARAQKAYRGKTWESRQNKIVFGAGPPDINFSCYTKKSFDKLGGYNEKLIGHDDVDLSKRAKKAGMKTVFIPDIVIYHKDPYNFKQVQRQAKWYARVLVHHQAAKDQVWTLFYLSIYPVMYFLIVLSALLQAWSYFVVLNILFFLPAAYMYSISKDLTASIFLVYALNPIRAIFLCPTYVYELTKKIFFRR